MQVVIERERRLYYHQGYVKYFRNNFWIEAGTCFMPFKLDARASVPEAFEDFPPSVLTTNRRGGGPPNLIIFNFFLLEIWHIGLNAKLIPAVTSCIRLPRVSGVY